MNHDPQPGGRRWTRVAAPLLVIVIAVGVALLLLRSSPPAPAASSATSTAPEAWVLPSLKGSGTVSLHSLRGKPVVVTLFASWCTACAGELPVFASAARQLSGTVTFVGVNSEESGNGLAMAQRFHITSWPLARDIGGANYSGLHDALGLLSMPGTALYSSSGKLLYVRDGALTRSELSAVLSKYFGTPPLRGS